MTTDIIAGLGGLVLSLLFSYAPRLQPWYSKLSSASKSLIMLGCIVLVAMVIFVLSCVGLKKLVNCDEQGAYGLLKLVFYAAVSNQTAYRLSPQKK